MDFSIIRLNNFMLLNGGTKDLEVVVPQHSWQTITNTQPIAGLGLNTAYIPQVGGTLNGFYTIKFRVMNLESTGYVLTKTLFDLAQWVGPPRRTLTWREKDTPTTVHYTFYRVVMNSPNIQPPSEQAVTRYTENWDLTFITDVFPNPNF